MKQSSGDRPLDALAWVLWWAFLLGLVCLLAQSAPAQQIDLTKQVKGVLPVAKGGSGTGTAFTTGSILFAGASGVYSQNNSKLFWDNTNRRLGIGTKTLSSVLTVDPGGTETSNPLLRLSSDLTHVGPTLEILEQGGVTFSLQSGIMTFGIGSGDNGLINLANNDSICWEASPAAPTEPCINLDASETFNFTVGPVNAAIGFQVAGAAASGNYLRGNGTNFVSSAILVGDLPAHASTHQNGGTDEVATATPSANAIPKAEADGDINVGWIPQDAAYTWTGDHEFDGLIDARDINRRLNSDEYDFSQATQSPEDDITAGADSVTLAPCPLGVNGTNSNHYIFLDDADDTPADEAVLITGGTCTSGAASGTVTFTAASTRTGGTYTVRSATAGIVEAAWVLPANGGWIDVPPGDKTIFQTVWIGDGTSSSWSTRNGIKIVGAGMGTSDIEHASTAGTKLLWSGPAGGTMIKFEGAIHHAGLFNILLEGNDSADIGLHLQHPFRSAFQDVMIYEIQSIGVDIDAYDDIFAVGACTNIFQDVHVSGLSDNGQIGFDIGTDDYGTGGNHLDVCRTTFRRVEVACNIADTTGFGFVIRFADALRFDSVFSNFCNTSLRFDSPSSGDAGRTNFPSNILFDGFSGSDSITSDAPTWAPTGQGIQFLPLLQEDDGGGVGQPPFPDLDWALGFSSAERMYHSPRVVFADLGAMPNGSLTYCTDCQVTSSSDNTCTSAGSGAVAFRIGAAWECFDEVAGSGGAGGSSEWTDAGTFLHPADSTAEAVSVGSTSELAKLGVVGDDTAQVTGLIRGVAAQTADLFQVQDSTPTTLFTVEQSGEVGIGTENPSAPLHIAYTDGSTRVTASHLAQFDRNSNDGFGYAVDFRKTRAGGAALANDLMADIRGWADDSLGNASLLTSLRFIVTDPTNGSEDGDFVFRTVAGGGAMTERLRLTSLGDLDFLGRAAPGPIGDGVIAWNSGAKLFQYGDGSATQTVVSQGQTQALTNKTIDGALNTLSNISPSQTTNALRDRTKSSTIESPATADDGEIQFSWAAACTMQRIWCSTDTGTVTIDLDERAEATPNTAGTQVIDAGAGGIVCDSDTQATASFANASIDGDDPVAIHISAVSGAGWVRIHARCRLD